VKTVAARVRLRSTDHQHLIVLCTRTARFGPCVNANTNGTSYHPTSSTLTPAVDSLTPVCNLTFWLYLLIWSEWTSRQTPGEFWLQFPRVSGEGQLGDPTPPGWPLWRTTSLSTTLPWRMLSSWLWISRCGDYWQQAELCTDGACRIMMMTTRRRHLWEHPFTRHLTNLQLTWFDFTHASAEARVICWPLHWTMLAMVQ